MYRVAEDWRFDVFLREAEGEAGYGRRIRALAREIACEARGFERPDDLSFDEARAEQCRRLLSAVQARVRYVSEDRFRGPLECWELGAGDCKSSATLLAAFAKSIGLRARLVAQGHESDLEPSHVVCELGWNDEAGGLVGWFFAETTVRGARLGEVPYLAARRLGLRGRRDLAHA